MDKHCHEALVHILLELLQTEREKSKKTLEDMKQKIEILQRQLNQFQLTHMQRIRLQREEAIEYYKRQDNETKRQSKDVTRDYDFEDADQDNID